MCGTVTGKVECPEIWPWESCTSLVITRHPGLGRGAYAAGHCNAPASDAPRPPWSPTYDGVFPQDRVMTTFGRVLVWVGLLLAVAVVPCVRAQTVAVVNARIVAGPEAAPIPRGTLIVRDGKIAAFGDAGSVPVPEGMTVLDAGRSVRQELHLSRGR